MADIKAAVASHLKADTAVSALVGERVYRADAPPNPSWPYITIKTVGKEVVRHATATSGLARAAMEIACWDDSEDGADTLANTVREAMDHFYGTMGTTPNTETVRGAFLDTQLDDLAAPNDASDLPTYAVRQTWTIWHKESIPTF